jgi:hypothetical protein
MPMSNADELKKLMQLKDAGALSDEEFQSEKAKVLDTPGSAGTRVPSTQSQDAEESPELKGSPTMAYIGAAIMIFSGFLPWVEGKYGSSSSFMGETFSFSGSTGDISGMATGAGLAGVILAGALIYQAKSHSEKAVWVAVLSLIDGIYYVMAYTDLGTELNMGFGSAFSSFEPKIGLFIYIIGSAVGLAGARIASKTKRQKKHVNHPALKRAAIAILLFWFIFWFTKIIF